MLPSAVHRALVPALAVLSFAWSTAAAQEADWTLQVCAQPDNLPFSDAAGEGFENRLARLLAGQLGARLHTHPLPRPTAQAQSFALGSGACDVVMGVSDGAPGFLTTLAYYRSHPVFVQRASEEAAVTSFDDPALRDLRIGVLGGGGARMSQLALAERELLAGVVSFPWDAAGPEPLGAPVRAVASGNVDVAVVAGPIGGYFAARQDRPLIVRPRGSLTQLPDASMVVPIAMGVRPHDEALRDLLDAALVARWDDVQAILDAYDVSRPDLPRPGASLGADAGADPAVGLGLPLASGGIPLRRDAPIVAAEAARTGAITAHEDLVRRAEGTAPDLRIASAPTPEVARRAARRLVHADGVVALLGGLDEHHAEALGAVAARERVPLLNVGDPGHELRRACLPWTVHVEPDEAAYLDAVATFFVREGLTRWLLVHESGPRGRASADLAAEILQRRPDVEPVGRVEVADLLRLDAVIDAIHEARPQAVLALLDWRAQLDLLSLYDAMGVEATLVGMPTPSTQTRDFYDAWRNAAGDADALRRVASWEASVREGAAGSANESYRARWGLPMDAPAWTAYQAVMILGRALGDGGVRERALLERLRDPEVVADPVLGTRYVADAQQVRPPLHLVRIQPTATRPEAFARSEGTVRPASFARCSSE